jgi:2-octaprenyl-6-methoxyphenol hydroxylase
MLLSGLAVGTLLGSIRCGLDETSYHIIVAVTNGSAKGRKRHMSRVTAQTVVVGGGPAGLTTAIALACAGIETALVARRYVADHRTTALFAGSVTALETLGAWRHCRAHAAPLKVMRIVDDTGGLVRAPEVRFAASEIGLDAFGYNIENQHLVAALEARASALPALERIEADAEALVIEDDRVAVAVGGRQVVARLAIGAEGRRSLTRAAAGIETDSRSYPQTALTLNLAHGRPHRDCSTEFHTPTGPFTLVPLPGQRSSLVYVADPNEAAHLAGLTDAKLSEEIERQSHSILGKVAIEPGRGVFPLTVETARRFAAHRVALVGEAAHVIPPIGAQGLNLGLRDAATVAELAVAATRAGDDIGSDDLTGRYERMRRADVTSRTLAVDLVNRSLLSGFLPVHGARGLGLAMLERIGPLRRAVMREGVAPLASQPRLMRGEAL